MVDVGSKQSTHRIAVARSIVYLPDEVLAKLIDDDIQTKKGSRFSNSDYCWYYGIEKNRRFNSIVSPAWFGKLQLLRYEIK